MKGKEVSKIQKLISVDLLSFFTGISVFIFPLIYTGNHISFSSLRYFVFGSFSLLLAFMTLRIWLQVPSVPKALFSGWYKYGLFVYVGLFGVVSFLSTNKISSIFSSFQRTDGLFAILFSLFFSLAVYTLVTLRGFKEVKKILGLSVLGSVVLSILIISSSDGIGNFLPESRGGATTGNSSVAATYVLFNIFFALFLFVKAESTRVKVFWATLLLILVSSPLFINWNVLLGQSSYTGITSLIGSARGALMGIIFGTIITVGTWFVFQKEKIKKYVGIGILAVVFLTTIFSAHQLLTPTTKIHEWFKEQASETRFIFWDIALKGFRDRPIAGWGPGNYDIVYHTYFDSNILLLRGGGEMWVDRTHNIFFETLVTGGITLLLGLIFLLVSIFAILVKLVKRNIIRPIEGSIIIGLMCAWLLQAQFIFESLLSIVMLFMVVAILAALISKEDIKDFGIRNLSFIKILLISIVGVLLFVFFVFAIFFPYKKDIMMKKVYTTNLPARAGLWKNLDDISPMGDGYDSVLMFNKVQSTYDKNTEFIISESKDFRNAVLSELEEVSKYLNSLFKKNPSDYSIGMITTSIDYTKMKIMKDYSGDILDRARDNGKKVIKLAPTDPQGYWLAGQVEMSSGNITIAKKLFEVAIILNPKIETSYNFALQLALSTGDIKYLKDLEERRNHYLLVSVSK